MSRLDDEELPVGPDEQAAAWCMRMAEGRLSSQQQAAFDEWVAQAGHREAFAAAVAVWQGIERFSDQPELIHVRSQALEDFRHVNSHRWARRLSGGWRWSAAAAATVLLGIFAGSHMLRDTTSVYETGIGERRVAVLEDGSRLSMDAATRIKVQFTDERRKLQLISGRAKFDVAKDPLRPFSVMAGGKLVVAVGTSFSVERLREQIRVVLYEGRVELLEQASAVGKPRPLRFDASVAENERTLVPGRELVASIEKPSARVQPADVPRSLSWEAGQLNFVNEPLSSAVERMNRYSKEPLEVGDAQVAAYRVNGVFTAGDIDAFIEGVIAFSPVEIVHRSGARVLVSAKKISPAAVPSGH